jgi:hypothetical protein
MKRLFTYLILCLMSMQYMNARGTSKIKITIGTTSFVATTYDNSTSNAFIALLPYTTGWI